MRSDPGTYALLLESRGSIAVEVGRLGMIPIEPGYYVYVGSAFGPGGVKARVLRHWRTVKPAHWHIDYLRHCLEPVGAWCSHEPRREEHRLAGLLAESSGVAAVPRFGASDCRCGSHLFHLRDRSDLASLAGQLEGRFRFVGRPLDVRPTPGREALAARECCATRLSPE